MIIIRYALIYILVLTVVLWLTLSRPSNLHFQVIDQGGNPIDDAIVKSAFSVESLGVESVTNSDGIATRSIPDEFNLGDLWVKVRHEEYFASSGTIWSDAAGSYGRVSPRLSEPLVIELKQVMEPREMQEYNLSASFRVDEVESRFIYFDVLYGRLSLTPIGECYFIAEFDKDYTVNSFGIWQVGALTLQSVNQGDGFYTPPTHESWPFGSHSALLVPNSVDGIQFDQSIQVVGGSRSPPYFVFRIRPIDHGSSESHLGWFRRPFGVHFDKPNGIVTFRMNYFVSALSESHSLEPLSLLERTRK